MASMFKSTTNAIADVANAVGTAASGAAKLVTISVSALDSLDRLVAKTAEQQIYNYAIEMENFYDITIEENSKENALRQKELAIELSRDADLKKLYEAQETKLRKVVNDLKAARSNAAAVENKETKGK